METIESRPTLPRPLPAHTRVDRPARAGQPARRLLAHLVQDRATLLGLLLVLTLLSLVALAPLLARHDPNMAVPVERLQGPSAEHWLGTDHLGRDIWSRLLWGGRLSLGLVVVAAGITTALGLLVGLVAGYYGGWIDDLLMRLVDTLLAFPGLVLALAIVGTLGPGVRNLLLGLIGVWWVGYARITRSLVLSIREQGYVEAARAVGVPPGRIIRQHVLPNVIPPVIVLVTLEVGHLLLAIAGLNFLGLGAQPPTPEWGSMLNDGRPFLQRAPQLMIYPGMAICLAVLGFNLLGDGLRDALDPHMRP